MEAIKRRVRQYWWRNKIDPTSIKGKTLFILGFSDLGMTLVPIDRKSRKEEDNFSFSYKLKDVIHRVVFVEGFAYKVSVN
ncbi:hypothetical protein D4R87_00690 [bacterium]|nr:MAG: hypothetical protein D4R87_00690 [bacterium]